MYYLGIDVHKRDSQIQLKLFVPGPELIKELIGGTQRRLVLVDVWTEPPCRPSNNAHPECISRYLYQFVLESSGIGIP